MERYKWVVLAATVFVTTFVFGVIFAFSSLLNAMLEKFGENRSTTSTVQSLLTGVTMSTGLLSGILIKRLGIWKVSFAGATLCPLGMILAFFASSIIHLYICIGIITALGISMLFICNAAALGIAFSGSQRLLALAIQNAGISLAGIMLPYLLNFLVDRYGLNGTMLVLGGLYLNCFPIAGIFAISDQILLEQVSNKSKQNRNGSTDRKLNNSSFKAFCKILCLDSVKHEVKTLQNNINSVFSIPYLLNFLAVGLTIASLNGYMSLVLDILRWKGLSDSEALVSFPVTYGVGLFARLIPGIVKQIKGVNSLAMPIIFSVCGCVGKIAIYSFSNVTAILIGCGLSGISISGVMSAANIVVVRIVGQENMAIGIGLINTAAGILSAVLGPTYGSIHDTSQSYDVVLRLTIGLQFVGVLLFVLTLFARKSTRRNKYSLEKHNCEIYQDRIPKVAIIDIKFLSVK